MCTTLLELKTIMVSYKVKQKWIKVAIETEKSLSQLTLSLETLQTHHKYYLLVLEKSPPYDSAMWIKLGLTKQVTVIDLFPGLCAWRNLDSYCTFTLSHDP